MASELAGLFECVVNVSEGRDRTVVDTLASAAGAALLDVHADPDHHRSVFTLGGPVDAVETAARRLAELALDLIDLRGHRGVHPRLGAVDVVPFVALDPAEADRAVDAARGYAGWAGGTLGVPVFLYDRADPQGRTLPDTRRDAFSARPPDHGPAGPHPSFGAVAVGARDVLVAVNWELGTADAGVARAVAGDVRERDGGLPGVRALGLPLASRDTAQVSMNLVDVEATSLEDAHRAVSEAAAARRVSVERVELVGLVPAAELARWSAEFRSWSGIGDDHTIEARLRRAGWLAESV